MLKKIYQELVLIRKELQAIYSSMEFKYQMSGITGCLDTKEYQEYTRNATR